MLHIDYTKKSTKSAIEWKEGLRSLSNTKESLTSFKLNSFKSDKQTPSIHEKLRPICGSRLEKKFSKTDRISMILIVISTFFILLNVPYVVSWVVFFVPFKQKNLDIEQVYFRFSFVHLSEILHMTNFALNFFFYSLGSNCKIKRCFSNK